MVLNIYKHKKCNGYIWIYTTSMYEEFKHTLPYSQRRIEKEQERRRKTQLSFTLAKHQNS